MIDLTLRCERILRDAHDPTLAILQCDCVIGYGSNPNPAEELAAAIAKAKEIAASEGRYISAICSIVGTEVTPEPDRDPQAAGSCRRYRRSLQRPVHLSGTPYAG